MIKRITYLFLILGMIACNNKGVDFNYDQFMKDGRFSDAETLLKEKILLGKATELDSIHLDLIARIRRDFPLTREDIKEQLKDYYPDVTDQQLDAWEDANDLEMRIIDGEKRYFCVAAGNLFRLNPEAKKLKDSIVGETIGGVGRYRRDVLPAFFQKGIESGVPFDRKRIKFTYTIRLKPNQVPDGEMVRCWMPYPRVGMPRSAGVELLSTSQDNYIIAPDTCMQRSLYMEKPAEKDKETVFSLSYVFEPAAQWFDLSSEKVLPYDKSSELYKHYTAERLPNIIFSDTIKSLAKQIVGDETNPVEQVKLIFYWMDKNIPWASALEYSIMPCIPMYVVENGHGDCGMQTFLFLSMARSLGIPCKWQSGWYFFPESMSMHDWAEVYYEGIGWVPYDQSYGLTKSDDIRVKEFYMCGVDGFRLIVNDDFSRDLYPKKKYYRSEPYDFQRGELEWKGGNLYFGTWTYKVDYEYL